MAQFDNPKSISLIFTGAFLLSLGVIAFFNIEMQSRSNHGTKIRNENLFEVLGKKLSQMVASLKEKNSYRRSVLYHLLISKNSTRAPMRKLQFYKEDSNVVDRMDFSQNRTFHRLRHEKKMRRLTELRLKQKLNASSRDVTFVGSSSSGGGYSDGRNGNGNIGSNNVTVLNSSVNTGNTHWVKSSFNATTNNETHEEISKEKLGVHQNCYTTNDVLEIIAITCLVNFIFWFLIISCVNIFTRNQKIWKSDSCESLASVESCSDYELKKCEEESMARNHSGSHHNIDQECVTLLNIEEEEEDDTENFAEDPETLFVEKSHAGRKSSERKHNTERWSHRKFINLPNLLSDMISLDNMRPVPDKSFVSLNKSIPLTTTTTTSSFNGKKLVNSLSMENLIF